MKPVTVSTQKTLQSSGHGTTRIMTGTRALRSAYYQIDQTAQFVNNMRNLFNKCNAHRGVAIEFTYVLGLNKKFVKLRLRLNKTTFGRSFYKFLFTAVGRSSNELMCRWMVL